MNNNFKKIGIIAAMDMEIDGIKKAVESPETVSVGGVDFVCGKIGEKEVFVSKCGVGKVYAAMCAQAMILRFSPDCIINSGIAGGLSRDLGILDCVVANAVVQHDMDTSPVGDPVGLISGINLIEIEADKTVSNALCRAAEKCNITCKSGIVATGDVFVAHDAQRERIVKQFGASCCEMEGGAVGQVCYVNRVPFAILRAISDGGDEAAVTDYPTFAARAAQHGVAVTASYAAQCAAEKQQIYQ